MAPMVVAPTIPLVAPVIAASAPATAKNGYPRQPQQAQQPQQQQQQPAQQAASAPTAAVPPQQPQVIPYTTMLMPAQPQQPQPVSMVAAAPAGSAQALPAVSAQPPNMVSTTMAQTPYFVTSTSSGQNVQVSAPNYNGATTILYVSKPFILPIVNFAKTHLHMTCQDEEIGGDGSQLCSIRCRRTSELTHRFSCNIHTLCVSM